MYAIIAVLLVFSITDVIRGSKKLKVEAHVTRNLQLTLGIFTFSYVVRVALNSYFYPFAPQYCFLQGNPFGVQIALVDAALVVEVVPYLGLMLIHYFNFKADMTVASQTQSLKNSDAYQTSGKQTTGSLKPESVASHAELHVQLLDEETSREFEFDQTEITDAKHRNMSLVAETQIENKARNKSMNQPLVSVKL